MREKEPSEQESNERSDQSRAGEVSLLDRLLVLARQRNLILIVASTITFVGLVYAMAAPHEYRSTVRVVREVQSDVPGGLSGGLSALRGLGIGLGGASSGLSADAYPDIIVSREVGLAVVRDTFYFPDVGKRMTYTGYVNRDGGWISSVVDVVGRYTVGLPLRIVELFEEDRAPGSTLNVTPQTEHVVYPKEVEVEAIEVLYEGVNVAIAPETGIMTIAVVEHDPVLAATATERILKQLQRRVRVIRTEKERKNLEFVETRSEEAKAELRAAEQELAAFDYRNRGISTAGLRTERERLQRQVRFAFNLYSEL